VLAVFGSRYTVPDPFKQHLQQNRRFAHLSLNDDQRRCLVAKTNPNAHAERFIRSIKESCLDSGIWFGKRSLRKGISEFATNCAEPCATRCKPHQ
jgi:hypothetical protein